MVITELEETANYDDRHADGAVSVISLTDQIEVVEVTGAEFVTSRIDEGEGSCVAAVRERDADFLVTDDYRALPELQRLVDAEVTLSPIVLRALVQRDALTDKEAKAAFESIAEGRDWLGTPMYRYARRLIHAR